MPILKIAPSELPGGSPNGFSFDTAELNQIARAEYSDTFGFYQRLFNVFGYMRMNRKQEYIVHTPKGTPLMWQQYKSCSYDPTGSIDIGRRTLKPELIAMNEQFCHDEFLDSAYEHWVEANQGGEILLTPDGEQAFQLFLEEVMANATYGLRLSLTSGQLYDVNTVNYSNDNPATITDLFKKTHGTVRGLVKLMYDLAATQYGHMNVALFDDGDFDAQGDYTGDIVKLLDNLKAAAPKPLKQLINHGGTIRSGSRAFMPIIGVSDSFFNSVIEYYNNESEKVATNRTRIVQREINTGADGIPQFVYYLDGRLPIIPLSDVSGFDEYLAGRTHFASIFGSGNLQMGHNFGNIPQVEQDQIGMMVTRVTDTSRANFGTYDVKSHAAVKAAIADPNYVVGTIGYTE